MQNGMETPEQRIARVVREEITISPYDPRWPESFRQEKEHLQSCLPKDLVRRIEHFGSTAVPGLAAKPIVDMLVEVSDLEATRDRIAPVLDRATITSGAPHTGTTARRSTHGSSSEILARENARTTSTWWRPISPSTGTGSSSEII